MKLMIEVANEAELEFVNGVLEQRRREESERLITKRRREAEIKHRYEILDRMYNSPEAIEIRAAVNRMCATHNV